MDLPILLKAGRLPRLLSIISLMAGAAAAAPPTLAMPTLAVPTVLARPDASYYLPAHDWDLVSDLPAAWAWGDGRWRYAKRLVFDNPSRLDRQADPVEVDIDFLAYQVHDLSRELRVVRVLPGGGGVVQVPAQICCEVTEDDTRRARLFLQAQVPAGGQTTYLVYYGNAVADPPDLATDLAASGQGYALEVANKHFRAVLAPSNGNLKSLYPVEGDAAFVGAGPPMMGGHGVEGTIHWGPDWSDELVGRYRLTSWDGPSHFNYDVVQGPVVVQVRRWGHPILSLGPDVGRPHKVLASVIYTFWAGQPYVVMESKLDVLEEVRFRDCRNDEWVVGTDLPDIAWMAANGTLGFGEKGWSGQDPRWMTMFDKQGGLGFASIHLAFENTHPSWEQPQTVAITKDGLWVRYPVRHATMRAGDFVYERNAYLLHHYNEGGTHGGFAELTGFQNRLTQPLKQDHVLPAKKSASVDNVIDALRATYDFELYIQGSPWGQRQLSVIDLGLVRQVTVEDGVVRLDVVMPYRGRDTWFGWFAERMEEQIRQRLDGVVDVQVDQVHEPAWSPQQMNDRARRFIGPAD